MERTLGLMYWELLGEIETASTSAVGITLPYAERRARTPPATRKSLSESNQEAHTMALIDLASTPLGSGRSRYLELALMHLSMPDLIAISARLALETIETATSFASALNQSASSQPRCSDNLSPRLPSLIIQASCIPRSMSVYQARRVFCYHLSMPDRRRGQRP